MAILRKTDREKLMKNVLITKQSDEFEVSLADVFRREGYTVYIAGTDDPVEKIDIYIDVSDERDETDSFAIRDGLDENVIRKIYDANVLKSMEMLEKYLPLLDEGDGKRICFLTAAEASINETRDTDGYAYKMSKAALHMFLQMVANRLTPGGYTYRIYDPMHSEVEPKISAEGAFNYFTRRRGTENDDPERDDENRLVFRDALGREHAW
jgi:NAD(P)-dependent dehydrogenase (short-subunit alcohol dehydrogenase family)